MSHPSKTAETYNFQIDNGDQFDDFDGADNRKSNAADRRDMARMGKPQEMKVRIAASPLCFRYWTNANGMFSETSKA